MEYLLIWILFACAAYAVASSRGRNKFLWFVIALFIGPFAVLILVVREWPFSAPTWTLNILLGAGDL